jgi:hydroxypyruvate isomerase
MLSWSAHISMLYAERPYPERPALARAAGFGWVESHWPATAQDRDALAAATTDHGLRVALVNTDGGDLAAGERGQLCDPARVEHARRVFLAGVELAARVGARSLHALVGVVPEDLGERAAWQQAEGMLRELVPEAASHGVAVVIEALNPPDVPGYLTPSPEAALRLAEAVGAGVLLDSYHMLRTGRDPAAEARRLAGAIGHVHVADAPGRGAPGTGDLDLWGFLDAVDAAGYAGPVGLEYDARGDTPASLAFLAGARDPAPFP